MKGGFTDTVLPSKAFLLKSSYIETEGFSIEVTKQSRGPALVPAVVI